VNPDAAASPRTPDPAAEIAREVLRLHDEVLAERTLVLQVGAGRRLADYCAGHGVEMARAYLAAYEENERLRYQDGVVTPSGSSPAPLPGSRGTAEEIAREVLRLGEATRGHAGDGAGVPRFVAQQEYIHYAEAHGEELALAYLALSEERDQGPLREAAKRYEDLLDAALLCVDLATDVGYAYEVPHEQHERLMVLALSERRRRLREAPGQRRGASSGEGR
jgi:hypothetical protein